MTLGEMMQAFTAPQSGSGTSFTPGTDQGLGLLGNFLAFIDARKRAMANNLADPGLMGTRGLENAADWANNVSQPGMSPMMNTALAGLTVYHGSPHKFSQFDPTKIGTGEGAQARGYGIYSAEIPATAKTYSGEGGNIYTADLPDEHIANMLHWDKPMSEQPPNVQQALGMNDPQGWAAQNPTMTGSEAYWELSRALGGPEKASAALNGMGIPGIRYLDQGSRQAGSGTSNYVVFPGSTDILKILGVQ